MKKIASVALSAALLLTLFAGCGAKETAPETTVAPETTMAPETTVAPEAEVDPETTEAEELPAAKNAAEEVMTDPSMPEPNEAGKMILKIYENHPPVEMPLVITNLDVNDADVLSTNTGLTDGSKIAEGAVSEPMMGQPYSLVLLKVKDPADAVDVAVEMYDNINMRKWVCMEADTKIAGAYEDMAFLFMVSSDFAQSVSVESMMDSFKIAVGGEVSEIKG